MRPWLHAERVVRRDFASVAEHLRYRTPSLLAAATDSQLTFSGDGTFELSLVVDVARRELQGTARVAVGVALLEPDRIHVPLTLRATSSWPLFPTFDGAIELRESSDGLCVLSLTGHYTPPFGALGSAANATGLDLLVDRAAQRLTSRLALELARDGGEDEADLGTDSGPRRVRDVMSSHPLFLHVDQPVRTAALLLHHYGISGAPVVDDQEGLVGVLSATDIVEGGLGPTGATVGEVCSRPACVTAADAPLQAAVEEMRHHKVGRLVVLDGARIAGVVSRHDVLGGLLVEDRALAAAVDDVIASEGVDLSAEVAWGAVTLHGHVPDRSTAARVLSRVAALEGICDLSSEVLWTHDDELLPQEV